MSGPEILEADSAAASRARSYYDSIARARPAWKEKNRYYHEDLERFVALHAAGAESVLEIGCGPGDLIARLPTRFKMGIDVSPAMIALARRNYPDCQFAVGDAQELPLERAFDCVVLSDTIGLLPDVQRAFEQLRKVTSAQSRVLITHYNYLWEPVLKLAEKFGLKMPEPAMNWLPLEAIENLLYLAGFEVVKKGYRLLLPARIPFLSGFVNRFLARLPLVERLCLVEWLVARPVPAPGNADEFSCSVMIPCRNERDNIQDAVLRTPRLGKFTELIFVDGASEDGTVDEILRLQKEFPEKNIRLIPQGGAKGKCDAVRKGLEAASGDVLMILDADLTVPPEELPKFFQALVEGKGEFVNGSRLVYPMEKQAMRFLNLIGNKFFGLAFTYLLDQPFSDTLCGTKALWRSDYARIRRGRGYFGDFDPFGDFELLFGACRQDLKIAEIPIRYRERVYGTTKIRRFAHGWLLLKMCGIAARKLKFL